MEHNPFDIIRVLSDDSLAWVEAAEELSAARVRVWELLADDPGEYIVFNQETKTLVAHFSIHQNPEIPDWWRHEDQCVPEDECVAQPAVAAIAEDATLDDDFDEYFRILQPAVA